VPIRYSTDDVPKYGRGAFMPVPSTTPLASSGGQQKRYLQQWTDAPDPNLKDYDVGNAQATDTQGSYSQTDPRSATYVPDLPLAFRPVVNQAHHMAYWASNQNMGPNGPNLTMKIFSDNPLPIPAQNPGRVAMPAMRTQPKGTIIATAWPRPFISWPTWGQSRQS
jgi:hypothetical protein